MRSEATYEQELSSSLTLDEAAGLLGVDERSLRLGRASYEADCLEYGEPAWARAIPINEVMAIQELF